MKHSLLISALAVSVLALSGCKSFCQSAPYLPENPKISILGDSYSTFEGVIPEGNAIWYFQPPKARNGIDTPEKTWWSLAIAGLGGTLEKNESFSGSTVCYTGYNKSDATKSSFVTRLERLGDPDLILVCGATNDSWANSPIGEFKYENWTNEELFSFRPAMAKMLADLQSRYPKAKVFVLLNDCLKGVINDSVHEICQHYNVPCIDLKGIAKGAGHPNVDGMKTMAEQTIAAVKAAAEPKTEEPAK